MNINKRKYTKEELEKVKNWGIWEKEPSEFPWEYDEKETCYILDGKAKVISDSEEVEFGKGDLVVFPKGLKCTWKIEKKIRKYYKFG